MRSMFTGREHYFRPWQRESYVMLKEAMLRLDQQIARLEREIIRRGSKRPEQLQKLHALHGDAIARRALVYVEIKRRDQQRAKSKA